jgi:hypothetical protein
MRPAYRPIGESAQKNHTEFRSLDLKAVALAA